MTTKGQVTIPKEVRQRLKLHAGDRVHFIVREDGEVLLKPAKIDIRELGGLLYRKGRKPVSIEAMDDGVARLLGRRR
ncbi:MAG TPA: AbrB/MazE/SpoVT family DNA-binding domain-containing protein [Vicinamibacteria bacterium]|jgi:AbrB family looped-hinge helix DNA binding protein|nr:AbrB/MazE/SpoVT family DNA-binding domain-containing protein [Vicinamibacteria bacterium]